MPSQQKNYPIRYKKNRNIKIKIYCPDMMLLMYFAQQHYFINIVLSSKLVIKHIQYLLDHKILKDNKENLKTKPNLVQIKDQDKNNTQEQTETQTETKTTPSKIMC